MTQLNNQPNDNKARKVTKNIIFWLFIVVIFLVAAQWMLSANSTELELKLNQFLDLAREGKIATTHFSGRTITGRFNGLYSAEFAGQDMNYDKYKLTIPFEDPNLPYTLKDYGIEITSSLPEDSFMNVFFRFLPWLILPLFLLFFMRQLRGSQKGIFNFGKSKAYLSNPEKNKITFKDVAGCDEPKEELEEIVEYLKNPSKFSRLGGKVPKGVLVLGSPGTGKTLLAKAVAGEANVPFYSMSGSDFVEMFVGVGASRVRDLFETGKKNGPCIIFIDEIDAVGRHRGAGLGGGHDEREQTLNQLLVEMDGFETNEGIIVLASTNRPDILDPALLRPGRFDRRVVIDRPDVKGREKIFELHAKNIKSADNIDFKRLAEMTAGLVGADIANIVNEAALLAAKTDKDVVDKQDFDDAKDKVLLGVERRSAVITDEEKQITAYHECGHALVAKFIPGADNVRKISIIPRGMALGVTYITPKVDKRLVSKKYLEEKIAQMLGGRAAEILVFDQPTSGAQNDIQKATAMARNMVCRWGMSDTLGPVNYAEGNNDDVFLGKELVARAHISNKFAETVDMEIQAIVEEGQKIALDILSKNIDKLHLVTKILLEKEVIDGEMLDEIIGSDIETNYA